MAIEISFDKVNEDQVEVTFTLDRKGLWQVIGALEKTSATATGEDATRQLRNELSEVRHELGWSTSIAPPEEDENDPALD